MNRLAHISATNIVQKLIGKPYAFAAWRMPQSSERMLIVSLENAQQTSQPLSELAPGFLLNRFADNHPAKPYHIKADLSFRNDELNISTEIGGQQIDDFLNVIEQSDSKASTTTSPSSNQSKEAIDHFEQMVLQAVERIKEGAFEKVVLARHEDLDLPADFSPIAFFDRICAQYPNAFCNMVYVPGEGIWIGATPELLLSDNKERFKTVALAGTKVLQSGQALTEIAWTQKEIEEQAFVCRYIINCFKKIRLREYVERGPKTVQAGNLAHLKTEYVVEYAEVNYENLADQLLNLLNPTSAVCGMPLEETKAFIESHETFDRSFYSGFLGPVNFDGSTDLYVNLRCMQIMGQTARLFAGAGITEDSIPSNERMETVMKMSVMKRMIF